MAFDYSHIDGALTPEQAAQALAMGEGDTSAELENSGAPEATNATDGNTSNNGDDKAGAAAEAETPAEAVVLARDGKHTIPYETLVKHRESEQRWKAQAEAAQSQLADLQAQAQARADAGIAPTRTDKLVEQAAEQIDQGADISIFGDFSEQGLATGIDKRIDQKNESLEKRLAALEQVAAVTSSKQAQDAASAHYDAIYGKHPDADSIAQSAEFAAWVNSQPSAVRNTYWGLFDAKTGGTADEIVEVFDAFKGVSTSKPTTTAAVDTKAAARAAVDSAKTNPPSSLSAIPGGHASGAAALDATADMSGQEMLAATEGMSPAQIEAWLNRSV